ncbi:MAG: hypothetical protein CMH53_04985, partial [Myxococcales bacterium]|nr:hypothetical protein [Myxococcales bacterium]
MTARPLFRAAFALATVFSLLSGCGSSSTLELFPQVEFTVEGQPGRSTWEFSPDTTRGQLTQQAAVLVLNSGEGQLDISEVKFETENPFLKLIYPKGKPSFPVALGSNDRLNLTVRFQPDPNIENNESATLTVKHNDDDKPDIVITFSIDLQGPKVVLKQKTAQFI